MQLATVDELADWTDGTIDSGSTRAWLLLETASAQVDAWCNKVDFEQTVDDVVVLAGTHSNRLELPGLPVESVSAVTIDGTAVTDWTLVRGVLWRGTAAWDPDVRSHAGSWGGPDSVVEVTYTHGFVTVPGEVKAAVLEAAARAWRARGGISQETTGPFSVSYVSGTAGVVLLPQEKDALSAYRRTSGALTL